MSSQNIDELTKQGGGEAKFQINGNDLSIANGSQIQLSGTTLTTGTDAANFQSVFNDSTTYFVRNVIETPGPEGTTVQFNLSLTSGGTVRKLGGGDPYGIDDISVVSFSLVGGICFLGNTLVNTDQGKVYFNELTTKNTINKHQIKKVVSVMNKDDTMVLVKKDSLGDFVPSKDKYISNNHKILIDGDYYEAKNIVNNFNIHKKRMPRKRLYNVLLDHHGTMIVNNMVGETLDPLNKLAQ